MNCVNKSSKEFKSLASRNNISDNALELIVHKYWREKGNESYFPSDSYVQAQLGAIPYEETSKNVKILWQKKYSFPQSYDTFEKLQSAIVEAQRYFPNEAIVHYQNANGKFVLAIRQPVRSFYKALDEAETKGYFEAPTIPLEVEEEKEYTLEKAQNLFDKFNKDRTSKLLADKVFKIAKDLGIKIYFNNILSDGNVGAYRTNNSITFSKAYFERGTNNDKKAATILHELIHAITTYAISDKVIVESLSKPLQEFRKDIHQLFTELQYNPALKDERGVLNEREFIAELSNPIFRQKIQAIDNGRKESFWQRVVNAIKELLGIHSSSPYYTRMMNTLDKAINAFDIKTYMEYNGLNNALRQGANDDVDYNSFIKNQKDLDDIKTKAIKNGTFMKAPNGKPTNLNEQQWLQVRTKAFKDWFGDWENDPKNASKVVDENGEPLVVYHGTTTPNITKFDLSKTRSGGAFWFANMEAQKGVFYSDQNDENLIMMPLFVNMRTPLLNDANSMESYATDETHDGGIILGKLEDLKDGFADDEYQELLDKGLNDSSYLAAGNVTNPNQLKSAASNIGTFSTENDDIDYNTLSTEDIKKEIHDYVNSLPEGAVKSKEALHSFINDLTESDIKNIYNEIEQNRNDVNLVVGKLRQLARDKKNKGNQKYFTFKDGKSVKAPFTPNDQQTEALDKIDDFLKSNKKVMTLSGYAGTGKTSIMEMIAEKAKQDGMGIVFTASTNKATQVLETKVGYLGFPVMTANKAFGIALEPGDKAVYDANDLKTHLVENKIDGHNAAIIDEASMINQENFDILTSIAKATNLKIIFVGDVAQLPPIDKYGNSDKLSPVFTNSQGDVITLTKVERTGDNAILKEATNLRNGENLSGISSFNKEGKGIAYIKPGSEERDKIIKAFAPKMTEDPDYFRILTYTNKSVAQYNEITRRLLGYTDNTPRVGETILGYSNYDYDRYTQKNNFVNSGSYKVVNVAKPLVRKIDINGKTVSLETIPVTIKGIDNKVHTYEMVDIKGNEANKKAVIPIAEALSNLWAQWKASSDKRQRAAILATIKGIELYLFVNDDITDSKGRKLFNKVFDFGYAMTIHKSQGSTFKNVLLDDINVAMYNEYLDKEALKKAATHIHTDTSNVDLSKNTVASEHSNVDNAQMNNSMSISGLFDDVPVTTPSTTQSISQEQSTVNNDIDNMVDIRRQLEYVGVSRATDTVTIISNNVKKEGSPLHPEATPSENIQSPTTSSNKTTPVRTGRMSFSYGNEKLNGVKADTTFDAIKNGERTATTRYSKDGHIDYWKRLKVGDVVEFTDGKGKSLYVEITVPLHKLDKNTTAEEWCKKEGWSKERFNNRVKPQIDKGEAYQMEFKYIGTPESTQSPTTPTSPTNKDNKTNDSSLNNNIITINKNEYTDEFRKLQKGSLELDEDKVSRFHRGTQQFTEAEQQRLGGIYERLLSSRSSLWDKYGINLTGKGNTFKIAQVDGQLFHDIFQINRQYLRNGELVDLHDNYDNAKCYITSDGLQGFAIEDNGNLVSVFSLNSARVRSKMGFLYAIKDFIKEQGATHLDCYNPSGQPIMSIYEKVFGFKPAATMDYNMEYNHDDIAKNHGNPNVVFMVANDGNVENKHFDKDSYDDAVAYQLKSIGSNIINPVQQVLSDKSTNMQTTLSLPNFEHFVYNRAADKLEGIKVDAPWKEQYLKDLDSKFRRMEDEDEEKYHMSDADKQYNQTLIDKMKVIINAKDKDDYLNDKQRDYKEKLQSVLSDYNKLNQQYANLLNGMTDKDGAKWCDSPFTVSEIRHVAKLVMDSISDTITDIQTKDGLTEKLFPNVKPEEGFDFKKASREDIIDTIGIENLLANAKKTFDTEHNNWFEDNCDDNYDDAYNKANFIYNNWDAIVKIGADIFAFNEGIGISRDYGEHKFNTTKETQPLTDDFNNDLDEDSLNEQEGDAQEHWQVNFRTIDTIKSMSALIRQAIHECYDLDENGQPKVHPLFGLKERVDERKVTNNILNWVQGARTIDEMVDKLSAQQKNNRWLSQFITRLQDKSGANADFQSQFFGVFCKHFQLYSIVIDQNGKYTCINANAHPALTEIMNGIKGKYHLGEHPLFTSEGKVNRRLLGDDKSVDDSNPFNLKQAFKHLPKWNFGGNHKEIDMSPEKMEEYAEWLTKVTKALGYDVNQELIADILNEKSLATMVEKLHFIVQDLEGAVKMEDRGEKYDPFKYKGTHNINSAIQNFMSPIAAVLEDSVTNSFFDSGKMYQSFVIPSFTTKLFQNLTQTNDEEFNKFMMEEYGKSEWFRGKEVFNRQTKKMEVQWNVPWLKWMKANRKSLSHRVQLNFNGHNYMKNLTDPEYALSVLAEYNSEADNTAWFRIPMESNKPSEEFIKFLTYKNEGYKKEIVEDLSDMVFMEISRIQTVLRRNLSKGDKGFIKNFDTNGRQFCFFPFLNDYITENGKRTILKDVDGNVSKDNAVLAELLQNKIKGEEDLTANEEVQLRKLIKDTTATYMQKRADNILGMMKKKGIVRASYKIKNLIDDKYINPKDATGKPLEDEELKKYYDNVTDKVAEQAIENFLWNDYLASKNILMIMVGDTAFYKDAEDLQKRLAELHAPGIRGNINATDYEGKKVSADGKYRTIILKDFDTFKSNIMANLNEIFDRKIAQALEHEKAAWKALKEDILKAYSEINVADAEGYSCMTSYRKKALMFGKWGKDAEKIYKKILAGNYTYTELKTAFQPMKPFVYTHLEKNIGVKDKDPISMMYCPFQAKNSEVLLVMADALLMHENTSRPNILRAIDNIMEDSAYDGRERDLATGKIKEGKEGVYNGKGIDTIQFESAIKSSLQGAIDLNSFLNDKNGGEAAAYTYLKSHIYKEGTNEYDVDNYVHEASFADYCIQQEIPEHFKNHSQAHGSQTRMIIPSDLDEYYDYSKDHNDPNNIVKYEWTDDSGVKHSLTAEEFRSNYESTISDNIYDSLDKLAREFHLKDSNDKDITDIKERNIALSQILVKEIDSSPRYGIDLRWACSLDENGEFNIPLGDPIQCKRIEQLINSIIKNRVNKQEIAGGPIVQVSNFGTSRQLHIRFNDKKGNLMPTEEEYNKAKEEGTLTDEQKKYSSYKDYIHENQGGIAYFEVFAPIWSDDIAEKFMDENGNIDMKAIEETNPEMLKLITYRIPTEDKYSMAPCKIVDFMPREAGDTIMLPYELTTIDGSDFDIDKRYVMRKDYRIVESKKKVGKYLYKKAEELIANEKKAPLTHDDKQTLHDKVDTFLDIINRPDADKILNGRLDKELRILYQEIHNDKEIMKHCYTTAPVDKNSKQFNDNEIVNMSWAVLTNPTSADKMLNPGGFELQKKVGYMVAAYKNPANADVSWSNLHAMKVGELKDLSYTQKDLAWFDTQMQFYKQNSAAASLIGIFAVNKIAHAVLEANDFYIDIPEICSSDFAIGDTEFKNRMKVDPRYDTNGSIIGKVLGSLVGASADAVKDPVLNLMNINITTAGMLNTMVRLGVPFEDAALFLSQDIVTRMIDEYNKRNLSNFASIDDVVNDFMEDIEKRTGLSEDGAISKEGITKEELVDGLREGNHDKADYKVLLAFTKLKALTDKMRNITFATRFNSISSAVGPLIVDNLIMEHKIHNFLTRGNDSLSFIKPQDEITKVHKDGTDTTEQAPTGFYTKDGKVVDINNVWEAHPILEAFKDTVKIAHQAFEAANMPTNSVKFRTILATLEKYGLTEKVFSDKKLLDQLSTFYQSYMLMASGLIDSKNLSYYINDFPKKFLEYQKNDKYSGNALIQAIKLNYSRQTNKPFLQIKITGMDAKEKEELSSAWVDLYKQDQKLATALFQYSFFRAGIGFSPKTFMALVPVYIKSHLSKTIDGETVTYKDVYKGKFNDQIVDDNVIDQFVRNNWDNNKLVPWVNPKKSHLSISYNSKTMTAYDKEGRSALAGKMYVKTSSNGTTYLWKKRGVLFNPEEQTMIYDMVAPLGNNGEYLEISTNEIKKALTDTKKPEVKDNQADLDIESNTTTDNSTLSSTTIDTKAEEKKEEKNAVSLRDIFINFNPTLANDHRAENLIESYKKNPEKYVGILQKIFKANSLNLNEEETIKKFRELC